MLDKIKYVLKNPEFLAEYFNRTGRLAHVAGSSEEDIKMFFNESSEIWKQVQRKLNNSPEFRMSKERLDILYACIRGFRPHTIIETGVAGGTTSWAILSAIEKNGKGKLYSIEIGLPKIVTGWLVPQELRGNWNLIIGDSKEELPKLLATVDKVDVFFHDSLHTYEHMLFEFNTVLPFMQSRKIILADDIELNPSFNEVVRKHHLWVERFYGFGVARSK